MSIKIGRQLFEDQPEVRVYHVRSMLTDRVNESAGKNDEVENSVLASILDIHGVVACQLSPYVAAVVKAKMFKWEEVEPQVKALLTSIELPIESVDK